MMLQMAKFYFFFFYWVAFHRLYIPHLFIYTSIAALKTLHFLSKIFYTWYQHTAVRTNQALDFLQLKMGICEGRLTCPANSAVVLASCSVQWILLGKLISGHPESSISCCLHTRLQLRDRLRKVAVGELWCRGFFQGSHKTECNTHYVSLSLCSHVRLDSHNKCWWG